MGDAAMKDPAESGAWLRGELSDVLELVRHAGGGVVFEDFPGDLGEDARRLDEVDGDGAWPSRAARGATAPALVEKANRLAETLHRLRRGECDAGEDVEDLVERATRRSPRR